jgi:hypothetical protein
MFFFATDSEKSLKDNAWNFLELEVALGVHVFLNSTGRCHIFYAAAQLPVPL